jgi:hypothetical protein
VHFLPRLFVTVLVLTGYAVAQTANLGAHGDVAVGHGSALGVVDGTLTAIGDHYKATFADGETVFTPLLGRVAPRNLPFALRVTHAGCGELAPVGPATLQHDASTVTFARTELAERFEVRPEGLKQSFVFDRLPPGEGDLVVRSRIATELRPSDSSSAGGLQFLFEGVGGVEVGQVLGIDADGNTRPGTLRTDGEHLDFVLPAAFVRTARLPLIVDPLLSSVVVTGSTLADSVPDIAPLPAPTDAYLVVWLRAVSAVDNDVRAQRVSSTGALLGGLLMIETTPSSAAAVTVAASTVAATWLVAWEIDGDIKSRFISSNGAAQTTTDIANGPNVQRSPCLAGGTFGGAAVTVCVWHDATANVIRSRKLDMAAQTGLAPTHVIASGSSLAPVSGPSISRDNPIDQELIVWTTTNVLGQRAVRGVIADMDGNPRSATFPIAGGASTEAFAPTCAGDGHDFVVAVRTSSSLTGNGGACAPVQFTFALPALGPVTVGALRSVAGPGAPPFGAPPLGMAVAMFQGSAFVAFSSVGTAANAVRALSVDPLTCSDCEGSLVVDLAGNDTGVGICSRAFSSANATNDGAVVFVPIVGGQGDVTLRLLRADDGLRTDLDIACTPGRPLAPCARAGNANFGVVLRGAAPNELTLVIHSLGLMNFNCNPCAIGPDTAIGIISFLGATSAAGGIRAPLALPPGAAAIGATLHSQFVLFGGQCLGNFRGTGGISATLQ